MLTAFRPAFAAVLVLSFFVAGCDLVQPEDDGPPAALTGTWETGAVDVPLDTAFALDGDPTYASVQIDAVYRVQTSMRLTDTGGDVRGQVNDSRSATWEIGYVRHDGVVVRAPGEIRIGGGDDSIEAVYIAPTLTFTRAPFYDYTGEFEDLALDFSDGSTTFVRQRLAVDIPLPRLQNRQVRLVAHDVTTTLRPRVQS
ncbi:MAG TPA: hypothetical protein VF594_10010 [Rubricoccaceae bacterium]|jgi:hypothetical protein